MRQPRTLTTAPARFLARRLAMPNTWRGSPAERARRAQAEFEERRADALQRLAAFIAEHGEG